MGEAIRQLWNPAVAPALAIARELKRACPVSQIPEGSLSDAFWLLFERGFACALDGFLAVRRQGHYHTSAAPPVSRKAMRHLFDNLQAASKPSFSGGLTQELGYVYIAEPAQPLLILYDTSASPGVNFK